MEEVYEIFKQIEETSGKNDKVQIIKNNSDNEEFKEFLKFLYDDMITTGLSAKKINKDIKVEGVHTIRGFDTPLDIMEYLTKFNTGTDKIIYVVQSYLRQLEEPYREFMTKVLTKSYKCGITKGSVNKALGKNFIGDFKVQLAHPYEKFSDRVKDFYLTEKLDGHRTLVKIDEDFKVTFRTRKGHEITGLNQIKEDIKKVITVGKSGAVVLDGEITIADDSIPKNKVFSETSKILRKDGDKVGLKFNVFDALSHGEFIEGQSSLAYKERREALDYLFSHTKQTTTPYLTLVPTIYYGNDQEVIPGYLKQYTDLGCEGLMLNTADGVYATKRTPDLLKIKSFKSSDVLVTGVFEGTSKYKGKLGGIYVDYKGNQVGIGSGFTDDQREYFWNNQDEIVGSIIEVKFFEETTNQKDDGVSLRFPIFQQIRTDKTEDDISYE